MGEKIFRFITGMSDQYIYRKGELIFIASDSEEDYKL